MPAVAFLAALALLAGACGGGGTDATDATETETPAVEATASSPFGPLAPTPEIPPSSVTVNRLSTLKSYFFTLVVQAQGSSIIQKVVPGFVPSSRDQIVMLQAGGAYVAPDKALQSVKTGSLLQSETIIGTQKWSVTEGYPGALVNVDAQAASRLPSVVGIWDASGIINVFGGFICGTSTTTVNDIETRHCVMDPLLFQKIHNRLGSFFNLTYAKEVTTLSLSVYLSQDGYPVKLNFTAAGKDKKNLAFAIHIQMDVLKLNQPADINPPRTS